LTKKQKPPAIKRSPTKHQLAKWQRQQRTQRITMIIGGVFIAFILGFIGYGYYYDQVKPFNQPVVRVNDTVFDMDYYIKALDIYSQGQDPAMIPAMADLVAKTLQQNELLKEGAMALGIIVSDEMINDELGNLNLSDDEVHRDMVRTKLLAESMLEDYFDPDVPTTDEHVQIQAMLLESKEITAEVIDRLKNGDGFNLLAGEFSIDMVTKENGGDLGWLPKSAMDVALPRELEGSLLKDIIPTIEQGVLNSPVYDESFDKGYGYWLIEVVEKDETQGIHARGILSKSWHEAQEIKAKLEEGEDFVTLVQRYSQHAASKELDGDLGWIQEGSGNEVIVGIVSELEIGATSEPVRDDNVSTKGGYWLVEAVDKDANRLLDDEVREILKAQAFERWLREQEKNSLVENYLDREQMSWAVAQVLKNRG